MYIYVKLHFTHSKEDIQLSDYIEAQLSRDAFVVVTVFLELMPHCYGHLGGSCSKKLHFLTILDYIII